METSELVNMIAADAKPSDISDYIKNLLYAKSAEKIDDLRPSVSANLFGDDHDEFEENDDSEEFDSEEVE
jgi:hypothetical protein